jgi:hypothetical protein
MTRATLDEANANWQSVKAMLEMKQDAANVHTINKAKMYLEMLATPQPHWITNDVTRQEYFKTVFTACRDFVNSTPNLRRTRLDVLTAALARFM